MTRSRSSQGYHGPVFCRGRLWQNGVRVLVIGQEGGQDEARASCIRGWLRRAVAAPGDMTEGYRKETADGRRRHCPLSQGIRPLMRPSDLRRARANLIRGEDPASAEQLERRRRDPFALMARTVEIDTAWGSPAVIAGSSAAERAKRKAAKKAGAKGVGKEEVATW